MKMNQAFESKVNAARTDLGILLEEMVYPALFARLESAYTEFTFRTNGNGAKIATNFPPTIPITVQDKRPERLVCYAQTPWQFMVHGHGAVRWIDYENGGHKPTGPDFLKVTRTLCEKAGVPFPEVEMTEEEREKAARWEERRTVLNAVLIYCQKALWHDVGKDSRAYLHGRGFTDEELKHLGMGYYYNSKHLEAWLTKNGYDVEAAKDSTLLWTRLQGYVIIPWMDVSGGVLTFYGRWPGTPPLMKDQTFTLRKKRGELLAAWEAKSPEEKAAEPWTEPSITKTLALPGDGTKSTPLYFDLALQAGHRDQVVAVEGVLDAAMAQCRGDKRVVGYVAATFSQGQIGTMVRHGIKSVIIVPDPDSGGDTGAWRSVTRLTEQGITPYVAPRLPDGLDPDEFIIRHGIDAWRQHIEGAVPGVVYQVQQLLKEMSPELPEMRRRAAADAAIAVASKARDKRDKTTSFKVIAERTGYKVADLKAGASKSSRHGHHTNGVAVNGTGQSQSQGRTPEDGNPPSPFTPYEKIDGCFWGVIGTGKNAENKRLCNFIARVAAEITEDDGAEARKFFHIVGALRGENSRQLTAEVPSTEFPSMAWVPQKFGAEAIIEAGHGIRDHVRSAIQNESAGVTRLTKYLHIGWRRSPDGQWGYLHAGGAILASGPDPSVSVCLDGSLARYSLPDPPTSPDDRRRAIRASLSLLRLGKTGRPMARGAIAALYAAIWRAAIAAANFSLQAYGASGSWKSSSWALAQQHYGAGMDEKNLPESWKSTPYALETSMFLVNCALLTIDDFVPAGSARDVADLHQKSETVFRSQGNLQARHRQNADGSRRPDRPPRGLLVSTGEDRVRNKSADARTLAIRYVKEDEARGIRGTIDKAVLCECQADARAGLYAAAMSAFLRWLAPRLDDVRIDLHVKALELRPLASRPADHPRAADIVAELIAGLEVFLTFAVDVGAIDQSESIEIRAWVWDGLMEAVADARQDDPAQVDAGTLFINHVVASLSGRQTYISNMEGMAPAGMEAACGWYKAWKYEDQRQIPLDDSKPNAEHIGWTDGQLVYLNPELSYRAARQMAESQGESFPVGKEMVFKLLQDAGKLAKMDSRNGKERRNRLTCRETIEKQRRNVLVLRCADLWPDDGATDQAPAGPQEGEV
jgi:DNA primase